MQVPTSQSLSSSFTTKRILLGITSANFANELEIRKQFRELFGTFAQHDDGRVCSLGDFVAASFDTAKNCQLVYTFVLGGLPKVEHHVNVRRELVTDELPLLLDPHNVTAAPDDALENDMTFLNIHENMKQGKSQTWLYRAQQVIRQGHVFDYVAKCDSDTVPDLLQLFSFSTEYLPPAPYNKGILVGKPCDKLWWKAWRKGPERYPKEEKLAKEGYFIERWGLIQRWRKIFHIYALGQFYMMSPDVVDTVIEEASSKRHLQYIEGNEDHDISTMALHNPHPIHFIFLSDMDMKFWQHPVKLSSKPGASREEWEAVWTKAKHDLAASLSSQQHKLGS